MGPMSAAESLQPQPAPCESEVSGTGPALEAMREQLPDAVTRARRTGTRPRGAPARADHEDRDLADLVARLDEVRHRERHLLPVLLAHERDLAQRVGVVVLERPVVPAVGAGDGRVALRVDRARLAVVGSGSPMVIAQSPTGRGRRGAPAGAS